MVRRQEERFLEIMLAYQATLVALAQVDTVGFWAEVA
jgi:hypothetical protein